MAKKLTIHDRRDLLVARERGLTESDMKSKFGIKDDRTLKRHLNLAEQEQDARLARMEILKEALGDHLAELRALIEIWKDGIHTQPITVNTPSMAQIDSLESNVLFNSLKSHLPFPALWRRYSDWKDKYRKYVVKAEELRHAVRTKADNSFSLASDPNDSGASQLFPAFMDWVLRHVQFGLERVVNVENLELEFLWEGWQLATRRGPTEVKQLAVRSYTKERGDLHRSNRIMWLVGGDIAKSRAYEVACRDLLISCLITASPKGDTGAGLSGLVRAVKDAEKILASQLEEIRLRRDYILYTCYLCPGQPRLSR